MPAPQTAALQPQTILTPRTPVTGPPGVAAAERFITRLVRMGRVIAPSRGGSLHFPSGSSLSCPPGAAEADRRRSQRPRRPPAGRKPWHSPEATVPTFPEVASLPLRRGRRAQPQEKLQVPSCCPLRDRSSLGGDPVLVRPVPGPQKTRHGHFPLRGGCHLAWLAWDSGFILQARPPPLPPHNYLSRQLNYILTPSLIKE